MIFENGMIAVFALAFIFEVSDSALGQGYGTLGSPTFLLLGFSPKIVVPAILISQATGGITAAFLHHNYKHADFSHHKTDDMKRVYFIVAAGIVGVIVASVVGFKLPKEIMAGYIGIIVTIMGILLIAGITFKFAWHKLGIIGGISAFNKGLSGGGYGPVVAGGQSIIGVGGKAAVAVTALAEAPICIAGFIVWSLLQGLPQLNFTIPMILGATLAPVLGTWITYKIPAEKFKHVLGGILIILGLLSLFKVLNP